MTEPALTWTPGRYPGAFAPDDLARASRLVREPACVIRSADGNLGLGLGGRIATSGGLPAVGVLPALYPEWLGDRSFAVAHGIRFPYVAGEMANGISTTRMVTELARADMLGFFGAGGLGPARIQQEVRTLADELGARPNWGVNLLHSPHEPTLEERLVDVLLRERVPVVSASAFVTLTPALVRCAVSGLQQRLDGTVVRPRRMFAKVSRVEVAERFMSPPPEEILRLLCDRGDVTSCEAELARRIPVTQDVTVEADSGGHTDNRPLIVVLPAVLATRDRLQERFRFPEPVRVGAAGGFGTPDAAAAAFALGAAYVVTGSVNQSAVESGLSSDAKDMLARADLSDVCMAPSADMFEQGVKVQVLRRGTLFAARATQLHDAYRAHESVEDLPAGLRATLENDVFGMPIDQVWADTCCFWRERDPAQLDRAGREPRHRMALIFRWYLGSSSRWAVEGATHRRTDYQIWCGPAMGAFNRWTAGTFLAEPSNRGVVQIALNLLEGAAMTVRAHQLRLYGLAVPEAVAAPRRLAL